MTSLDANLTPEQLAGAIDHTLLSSTATEQQIEKLCMEARKYHFHSVCVNPCWVAIINQLKDQRQRQ